MGPRLSSEDPGSHVLGHRRQDSEAAIDTIKPGPARAADSGPVTWMSLPRKDQLFILFLCRFADFLQIASMQTYVYHQLKSLDGHLSDAQISNQAGILQGGFTGAQVLTAVLWGRAADASWCGRKRVVLIGILGTSVSCLGYGFATSFGSALFWRVFGGAINGIVGIIRTMVYENTIEKKYQSRAFLILPLSFNVAGVLGPIMGGWLADPASTLPGLFGPGGRFECSLVKAYPYALPSITNAVILALVGCVVALALEETGEFKGRFDLGLHLAAKIRRTICGGTADDGYSPVPDNDAAADIQLQRAKEKMEATSSTPHRGERSGPKLPFNRIFTRNLCLTLAATAFYDFHLGAFTNMWTLFLTTPRHSADGMTARRSLTSGLMGGGLGMPAPTLGFATSILGWLGMLLQICLYPPVNARLGTLKCFQWFLLLFPLQYLLTPYLAVLPSDTRPPGAASGPFVWTGIVLILLIHTAARTMTLPASIILVNNASPHPSVLSTVHTLGQSVSAGFRTVGPVMGGYWYGKSLEKGVVGASWWAVAAMSAMGWATATLCREGGGHDIYLEGDEK